MRSHWVLGIVLVSLLASASALAQSDEDVANAKAKYEEGKTAYRLGKFDEAIAAWKQAYELKSDPIFLYNIAQAYREAKDYERAAFFYRSYLNETQNPEDRKVIEQRITEMEELLEMERDREGPAPGDPEPTQPEPPPVVAPIAAPPAADTGEPAAGGRGLKVAGIVTGGAGVVLIATGVAFGVSSRSDQDDVQAAIDSGTAWTQELQDKEDSGRSKAAIANVTLGIGIAAAIGGGVLYYLGVRRDDVEVTPTGPTGGVGATFTLRY
jgi:tetratricopeptide (TPR) repeat protein